MRAIKNGKVRIYFYLIGIIMLSFGISCSIYSQLGASPLPALQVGLQHTIGLTVGSWEFIMGVIFVMIAAIVRRNRPDILAFLTSFLIGLGIDLWMYLIGLVYFPDQLLGKLIFLVLGLMFTGLGVSVYLQPKFSPAPSDGIQILMEEYLKIKLSTTRTLFSIILAAAAFFFNGPLGIGTLIMILVLGPIIGALYPIFQNYFTKLSSHNSIPVVDQHETHNKSIH